MLVGRSQLTGTYASAFILFVTNFSSSYPGNPLPALKYLNQISKTKVTKKPDESFK
jgi:hypothetical protein